METTFRVVVLIQLVLVVIQLGLLYLVFRYLGEFVNKIRSLPGVRLNAMEVGKKAPPFQEVDENGDSISLHQALQRGKALLFFVHTDCPACKTELPRLSAVAASPNWTVIVINGDEDKGDQALTDQLPEKVAYIRAKSVAALYSVTNVPYSVVVDPNGMIVRSEAGTDWLTAVA